MKKAVSLVLAIVMAIACLSGCGNSAQPSGTTATQGQNNPLDDTQDTQDAQVTQIDFFDSIYSIGVSGFNGQGSIWDMGYSIDYIEYDKENSDITDFLKDVKLDYQKTDLSNGDILTVTISYSKSTMEELGIRFKETSRSFTIFGLLEANNPPATEDEIDAKAFVTNLQEQLPAGDQVVSSYYCYFLSRHLSDMETVDGKMIFPEGYDYCNDLLFDGGVHYIYSIDFIVSSDTGYYLCEAGVNPDGTQCGEFSVFHRRFETEDEALEKLENRWGKEDVVRIEGI